MAGVGGLSGLIPKAGGEDDVWVAARMGRRSALDALVAEDAGLVGARDPEEGGTPLHWAARGGAAKMVAHLVAVHGAALEVEDGAGARPLHWAARGGDAGALHALLEAGAEVDARDAEGRTPLHVACASSRLPAAVFLIARGAEVSARNADGRRPLHAAADRGHGDLCAVLVRGGADVDATDSEGRTALHVAAEGARRGSVERLLELGASASARDREGKTPGQLAALAPRGGAHVQALLTAALRAPRDGGEALRKLLPGGDPPGGLRMWRFFLGNVFVGTLAYWGVVFPGAPDRIGLHLTTAFAEVAMLFCLYHTRGDPGYASLDPRGEARSVMDAAVRAFSATGDPGPFKDSVCHQCAVVRAPRQVHCEICGRCVARYDHHCPFVLNCVGERNRLWFLGTVWAAVLASACVVAGAATYLMRWARGGPFAASLIAAALVVDFLASALYAINLGLYHIYLAAKNKTTHDALREQMGIIQPGGKNPYDMGLVANLLFFFGLGTQRHLKHGQV